MSKKQLELLVRRELNKYGLHDWKFNWSKSKVIFGRCWYLRKQIDLSSALFDANVDKNFDEVWDTVLHEIAHALSYVHNKYVGHGDPWKKWCCIVGAKPQTFYDSTNVTPAKFKYHLLDSNNKFMTGYHRLPKWGKTMPLNSAKRMMVNGQITEIKLVKV